jgi:glutamyl/glutaminyl-tRNA synthetase
LGLTHADIEAFVKQTAEQHGVKAGDFISPMRLCVSGRAASASFFELVETLPWEVVGPRLEKVQTL